MDNNVLEFNRKESVYITNDFAKDYKKNYRKLTEKELNKVKDFISFIGQNKKFPENTKLISMDKKDEFFKIQIEFGIFTYIIKKKGMYYLSSMVLI